MAKLTALPSLDIISGFKGVIDFYVFYPSAHPEARSKGVPCARRWPRSPGHRRAAAVEAQWQAFSYSASLWLTLQEEIQDTYRKMASGTGLSGRDMFTRSYLKGLYSYPTGA